MSKSKQWVPVAACLPLERTAQEIFQAAGWRSPSILLESARLHPATGRYSILAGDPRFLLTARGSQVTLTDSEGVHDWPGQPLQALEHFLKLQSARRLPHFPPFVGGAIGYFGYDSCAYLDPRPLRAENDLQLPDMAWLFVDETVVVDHALKKLWVIALAGPSENPEAAYDDAVARIERLLARITRSFSPLPPPELHERPAGVAAPVSTHTRESFGAMVREAKELIAAGDIYQANLSQRFTLPLTEEPWALYRRLAAINPSPFACFADFSGFQVVSASPERLLRVKQGTAETRPIAGTRPKGKDAAETARLRQELILNEKERAEHLMLVDLERNDLGRICRAGSVRVDEMMALETYSHVIHIVSNVRGTLRSGSHLGDIVAAVFPGGTITGCPKIRCMEIIDALEPVRRQLYTGSAGYLSYTGDIDTNILIRTGLVTGGNVHVQAGAGIVADSDPGREYDETVHKAQALVDAFQAELQPVGS